MPKKPKPAKVDHSIWPQPEAETRACTSVTLPKGTRLIEIIACEGSKPGVHGGIHAPLPLPSGIRIDTILVYHEIGERAAQPEIVLDKLIKAVEEWAEVARPAANGDQEAIPKMAAADRKLLDVLDSMK